MPSAPAASTMLSLQARIASSIAFLSVTASDFISSIELGSNNEQDEICDDETEHNLMFAGSSDCWVSPSAEDSAW